MGYVIPGRNITPADRRARKAYAQFMRLLHAHKAEMERRHGWLEAYYGAHVPRPAAKQFTYPSM